MDSILVIAIVILTIAIAVAIIKKSWVPFV